jgi:spermidine synthase
MTGAAVLIIEVAAVRILSPYYGASLSVFSSVLTIILTALSLGYYFGGKLADTRPRHDILYSIIGVSGVMTLTAQFLATRVLPLGEGVFSVISGPLFFGFLFFFLPGFLLGIVSPYLIKLVGADRTHDEIGQVSGTVFFFGTAGSIVGSLLSGFILIPLLGIRHTMIGTGLSLILLGIIGLILCGYFVSRMELRSLLYRYGAFILFLLTSALVLVVGTYRTELTSMYSVLHESDGVYGHIVVYETTHRGHPFRGLRRDTNSESAIYLDSYQLPFWYTQFAPLYSLVKPDTKNLLMIGGGAYTIPRTLLHEDPNLIVDVVEVEPDLYPLAVEFFDLTPTPRLRSHIVDGRVFLRTTEEKYDIIFQDVFGTDLTLPQHLATREYFALVRDRLSPDGVLFVNYIGRLLGDAPTLTGSLMKTIHEVFPTMNVYLMYPDTPSMRQNIMIVARNGDSPLAFPDRELVYSQGDTAPIETLRYDHTTYTLDKEQTVFTDDRAPVEYLLLGE